MKTKICCFLTVLFLLSLCAVFVSNTDVKAGAAYIDDSGYCLLDGNFDDEDYNKNVFAIKEPEHFEKFAQMVVSGLDFAGKKVILLDDLSLTRSGITLPSDSDSDFRGTFDGQGFAIYYLYGRGLFFKNYGTVLNLDLEGFQLTGTDAGGIAIRNYGTIFNCTVSGTLDGTLKAGGIASSNYGTINYCTNNAAISVDNSNATSNKITGGIAAENLGYILNCANTGAINSNVAVNKDVSNYTGGIAGATIFTSEYRSASITNCYNIGSINVNITASTGNANIYIGGVLGCYANSISSNTSFVLKNCYNNSKIERNSSNGNFYVGRIIGSLHTSATIFDVGYLYYESGSGGLAGNSIPITITNMSRTFNVETFALSSPIQVNEKACPSLTEALDAFVNGTQPNLLKWQSGSYPEFIPIHNVKFNTSGGEWKDKSKLSRFYSFEDVLDNTYYYYYQDMPYNLSDLLLEEKDGYKFDGWFDGDTKLEKIEGQSKNLNLSAKFSKIVPPFEIESFNREFTYNGSNLVFGKNPSYTANGDLLISGLIPGDKVLMSAADVWFDDEGFPVIKDAGTYEISFKIIREGQTSDLYSFIITVKPATVEIEWKRTLTYDGSEKKPTIISAKDTDNDTNLDTALFNIQVQEGSAINVGTYTAIVTIANANYIIINNSVEFTITKAAVKIKWNWSEDAFFIYDGSKHKPDLVQDENYDKVKDLYLAINITEGDGVSAGTHKVTATIVSNNYILENDVLEYMIKAVIKIEWDWSEDGFFTYNGAVQKPGLVQNANYDTIKGFNLTITVTEGDGVNAGTHKATATIVSENYILDIDALEYIIKKAAITIEWQNTSLIYSGSAQIPSYIIKDSEGNLTSIILAVEIVDKATKELIQSINAGVYIIQAFSTDNYEIVNSDAEIEFTILKADVTVILTLNSWVAGETSNNYNISNLPSEFNALTPTVEYKLKSATVWSSTKPTEIGEYTIRVTYGETANYNGFNKTTDFEITAKDIKTGGNDNKPMELQELLIYVGAGIVALTAVFVTVALIKKRRNRFIKLSDK